MLAEHKERKRGGGRTDVQMARCSEAEPLAAERHGVNRWRHAASQTLAATHGACFYTPKSSTRPKFPIQSPVSRTEPACVWSESTSLSFPAHLSSNSSPAFSATHSGESLPASAVTALSFPSTATGLLLLFDDSRLTCRTHVRVLEFGNDIYIYIHTQAMCSGGVKLQKPRIKSVNVVSLHPARLLKLQQWTSNRASWFTALAGDWMSYRKKRAQRDREIEREHGGQKCSSWRYYLLFGCGTPFRGWLTTTGWLSHRRRESNFFSRRQQLCRVQAKLQRSLPLSLSLSLLQSLFLYFFLSRSSFCPPSSTGCSLARVISLGAQAAGAGARSRTRRALARMCRASGQWRPPFSNPHTLGQSCYPKSVQHWRGEQMGRAQRVEKTELERVKGREGVQIKLCLMRKVCAY